MGGRGGVWQEALRLFSEVKKEGLTPDVITYIVTMSACGKAGEWQEALRLFSEMKEGITPDVITYSVAISACEKAGQRKESDNLLRTAIEEGLFRDCFRKEKNISMLDLHRITLDPAKGLVRYFLEQLFENHYPDSEVVGIIITGKGNHVHPDAPQGLLQEKISEFICEELGHAVQSVSNNLGRILMTATNKKNK